MKSNYKFHRFARKTPKSLFAMSLLALGLTALAQDPAIVGETTMVIGLVKLVAADGTSAPSTAALPFALATA